MSERVNILIHGGNTRRIITVEVGRNHKRGQNFTSKEEALNYVRTWLGVAATSASVAGVSSDEVKQRARAVKDLLGFLRVTPLKLNEEDAMTLSMLINAVTATDVEQEK